MRVIKSNAIPEYHFVHSSFRFHIRVIGRNVKELIYHWVAAILILIASIIMCVVLNDNSRYWHDVYKQLMAAAVSRCDDDFIHKST